MVDLTTKCDENLREERIFNCHRHLTAVRCSFKHAVKSAGAGCVDYCRLLLTDSAPSYIWQQVRQRSVYLCHHPLTSCYNSLACAWKTCLSLFLCAFVQFCLFCGVYLWLVVFTWILNFLKLFTEATLDFGLMLVLKVGYIESKNLPHMHLLSPSWHAVNLGAWWDIKKLRC